MNSLQMDSSEDSEIVLHNKTNSMGRKSKRMIKEEEDRQAVVNKRIKADLQNTAGASKEELSEEKLSQMTEAVKTILECLGEDPEREGLKKTPLRVAKALLYCTKGYTQTAEEVVSEAVFEEDHNEMVLVRDIDIASMCEHHMVPFLGKVHIAYIPNSKVLGLSKLARIAEVYARRLQVQERLTRQIAEAIMDSIDPKGVAVVCESQHMCMVMRGVEKTSAITTTSSVLGVFKTDPRTRAEFFSLLSK